MKGGTHGYTYQKIDAIVSLIRFFDAGGQITTRQLAENHEVTIQTAQRWLQAVERWVPLEISDDHFYRKLR